MKRNVFLSLAILFIFSSCFNDEQLTTGIEGKMFKGPIRPVEIVGQANVAPLSAKFYIYNLKNTKIASFISNENGEYMVMLSPGSYHVIPDKSTPILGAEFQIKEITVNTVGITNLDLHFDTGIR